MPNGATTDQGLAANQSRGINEEHNMNTWGAQAVHATLIPGVGSTWEFGSVSAYSFALGAAVMLLALVAMKSPRRLNTRWRPSDLTPRVVRLSHVLAGMRRNARSRFRQWVDLRLVRMLGDDADEQPQSLPEAKEDSRPQGRSAAGAGTRRRAEPISGTGPTRGYQSKHRLSEPQQESQDAKPAPRHAAPPREPLLPPN